MTVLRMDHVGVVVEDLDAAIAFFTELGLHLQGGKMVVDGSWVDRVVGLGGVQVEIAMMRTPDKSSRLELTKFLSPAAHREPRIRRPRTCSGSAASCSPSTTSATWCADCRSTAVSSSAR